MKPCNAELNSYRIRPRGYYSPEFSDYGLFIVPFGSHKLHVMSSGSGDEWEHVSVSLPNRCPNWNEMCFVKDLFWNDYETVIQFHPKATEYVNNHPYCLHLWKKTGHDFELPPSILVGIK